MNINKIASMPTFLSREQIQEFQASGCSGVHESVLAKHWLKGGMPSPLILELLSGIENWPPQEQPND